MSKYVTFLLFLWDFPNLRVFMTFLAQLLLKKKNLCEIYLRGRRYLVLCVDLRISAVGQVPSGASIRLVLLACCLLVSKSEIYLQVFL